MVGVAGRSKGCHTCKSRKIKCDEGKPRCQRCIRSKRVCLGYEKPLAFRVASTARGAAEFKEDLRLEVVNPQRPPPEMPFTAFRDPMSFASMLQDPFTRTWASAWFGEAAVGKLGVQSSRASRALSQLFFAIDYPTQETTVNASIQYGRALQTLRDKLPGADRHPEQVIFPTMMLMLCSATKIDLMGMHVHLEGVERILRQAGPKHFRTPLSRIAYELARAPILNRAIILRQRIYLEQKHWRELPYANEPQQQSGQSYLVNIFVFVPGFLEDDIKLQKVWDPEARIDLVLRVSEQLRILFQWRWRWSLRNPHAVWTHVVENLPNTSLLDVPLHFDTLEHSSEIAMYDAILIHLLAVLMRLCSGEHHMVVRGAAKAARDTDSPTLMAEPNGLSFPGDLSSLKPIAIELARVFQFELYAMGKTTGFGPYTIMPVGAAWKILEHDDDSRQWLEKLFSGSKFLTGFATQHSRYGLASFRVPTLPDPNYRHPNLSETELELVTNLQFADHMEPSNIYVIE